MSKIGGGVKVIWTKSKRTATFFVKPSLSKWALLHNTLKNLEFRKKNPISKTCVFHLFHQQIDYCVFNMTHFLYVLWYSTDFAGVVLVQTNIASIQSFLRPGLYVFAEPYCLSSANMCSSFQENSRPWSQRISKIVGIYYIQIKVILLRLWCFLVIFGQPSLFLQIASLHLILSKWLK